MQSVPIPTIRLDRLRQAGMLAVAASILMAFTGCATFREPAAAPLTIPQIVSAAKEGLTADEIIARMEASNAVYRLSATQLALLENEGVPGPVINYMQQTYIDSVRRDERSRYDRPAFWNDGNYIWYGNERYGWPICPHC